MSVNTPNKQTSHLKREILVRLIKAYLGDNYAEDVRLIPYRMRPQGSDIQFRCCIHKERAILRDEKLDLLHWLYHKGFDDAVPLLLKDFYDSNSVTDKWAIADTIYVIQSKSYIEEYIKIITDTELGISRQMIVLLVGKLKVEKAIPILEELLDDETVRLHALTALGYYKQERLCKHFEKYKESKNAALRKCAKNSLEMLTKKNQ